MAIRQTTHILKNSNIVNRPLASSLLLGEPIVNTADGIMYFSGNSSSTNEWTPAGTGTTATFFEVGSNLYDLKIRNKITQYNGLSNISGKFLSGTTSGFELADISLLTVDTYVTGFTYDNSNNITISQNEGQSNLTVNISTVTGWTINGALTVTGTTNLDGTSYYTQTVGGTNGNEIVNVAYLTGYQQTNDVYITGATYTPSTNNTAQTTFSLLYHGTPLNGPFTINGEDTFATGGTYNSGTTSIDFTRNDGSTFSVDLSNIDVNDTSVTSFTYNNNTFTITDSDNNSFTATINSVTGFTVSGDLTVTNDTSLQATTASTLNLSTTPTLNGSNTQILSRNSSTGDIEYTPISAITPDTFVTAFTYSDNTLTISQNQGVSDLNVTIDTVTGLTVNGDLTVTGTTYSETVSATTYQNLPGSSTGNCFTDFYVTNIHGCSPITFFDSVQTSGSTASGTLSFAFGNNVVASGDYSHAEGSGTTASGLYSHASGYGTIASGDYSTASGYLTTASGWTSTVIGIGAIAGGQGAHAEGGYTTASGNYSHAEGRETIASGIYSHAEGNSTIASGDYSHAEGEGTITTASYQHAVGRYNATGTTQGAFFIGNGTTNLNRSNVFYADSTSVDINQELTVNANATVTGNTSLQATTASTLNLSTTPTLNNANTQILSRNGTTGEVQYSEVGSLTQDTYVTAFTYSNNTFTILQNLGQPNLTATFNSVTGLTVNGDLTVTNDTSLQGLTATSITNSSLTAGRVVYVGTGGQLTDESGFEYNDSTNLLTVGNINVTNASGTTASIGQGGLVIGSGGSISTPGIGDLVIHGDLTVFGTETIVATNELYIEDPQITLNYNPTGNTDVTSIASGIRIQDGNGNSGDTYLTIGRMDTLTGLTPTEIPVVTEYTGSTGYANRGWVTQLNDIVIRNTNLNEGAPNGVRVLAEFDVLDGGTY